MEPSIEELLEMIEQREDAIEEIRKDNFGREVMEKYKKGVENETRRTK